MDDLKDLLMSQNIKFKDFNLYKTAFTHSSYTHESKDNDESYERMEFLGDSILGKIVAEKLFLDYPEYDQGVMTLVKHFLVNKNFLAKIGKKLKFEKYLFLGAGEQRGKLSISVYEDVFESFVAAIYLDLGTKEVTKFIQKHILSKINEVPLDGIKDSKTKLQELLQSETRKSIEYKIINEEKINNINYFTAIVLLDGIKLGEGKGLSKKEAEKEAAKDAEKRMVK